MKPGKRSRNKQLSILDSRFEEIQTKSESLTHEDVRVVTGFERALQLLQLPAGEVGASSTTFSATLAALF